MVMLTIQREYVSDVEFVLADAQQVLGKAEVLFPRRVSL
jgi:hypothetical protein